MSTATTADEKQPIPNQVFVGGMTPDTKVEQLTKHFESLKLTPAGAPTFFQNPEGVSKGCALVPFGSAEAADNAIKVLAGSKIGESTLTAHADRGPRKPRREVNQDSTYLYVGNLDPEIKAEELHDLFGALTYCNISRKRRSERSLAWATVQLGSVEQAQKAQAKLNGQKYNDRVLTVEPLKSIPRPARKPRPRKDPASASTESAEEPTADPCIVWVGNLPFETTEENLQATFGSHGEVKEVVITRDKRTGDSRGWGTVTYATAEQAETAVKNLNDTQVENRQIHVQIRRGPRVRRRRVQPAPAAAQNTESDAKERGGPRPRRRFRRGPRVDGEEQPRQPRRRPPRADGDEPRTAAKEPRSEGEGKGQGRARRPRVERNDNQEAVTMHVAAEGGEGEVPKRRRRRRRKPEEGGAETGGEAKQEQAPRPRRERKEPDKVVDNPECHLYLRNIPFESTAEDLKAYFEEKAGTVISAAITMNSKGFSRGWGTVEMGSSDEAQKGLALDKQEFQGRELIIRLDNRVRGE
jgi:RNA recognition motif-containing protein